MKRTLLFGTIFLASQSYASNGGVNLGSSMTTGPSSNPYSMAAASNNPALNALIVDKDENFRTSYFPNFGVNVELGDVDDFIEEVEDLTDIIDDPSLAPIGESTQQTLDRFNLVLKDLGESGYLKNSAAINVPLFPLYFQADAIGGTIGFSLHAELIAGISILDEELQYNNQNSSFTTATSIYLKAGVEKTFAVSYGRDVPINDWFNEQGTLYAGVKLKAMNMELSKQVIPLESLDSDDIGDIIKDEYDNNQVTSTELGVDIGVAWVADNYSLGLTLENANSPEFEYGAVGVACSSIEENTPRRTNCEAAAYFSQVKGEIDPTETYTKDAMLRADILFKFSERWQLTSAIDLAEYNDVIGFENQWLHVATTYDADSWILPSVRLGYHSNLAGTETSSASLGFTLFNSLALDFEYGLESIDVDGTKAPRRAGFSLSMEESF